jgi:putative ABC transport system permease protein
MALYLSTKELWRSRGRYLLFSLIIALITTLVLFVAALGEGLGSGNREFIQRLTGELVVYDSKADLNIGASRMPQSKLTTIRRVAGVEDAGLLGFSNATILYGPNNKEFKVALVGVQPDAPGEPVVEHGERLGGQTAKEVILDLNVARRTGLKVGDTLTVRSTQGNDENLYPLRVVGIAGGQQYGLQQTIMMPYRTFDRVRPQSTAPADNPTAELVGNVAAVRLTNPADINLVRQRIEHDVANVEAVDRRTAYTNTPGYTAQQSTLDTQRYFALIIGVLVIGGFFQIQTLQKVPQIGMLKAIGTSNTTVALAAMIQIVAVTILGVGIGSVFTLLLSLSFPAGIPIVLDARAMLTAVASLMLIGPIGGLVSVRYSVRIEPLTALGLSA